MADSSVPITAGSGTSIDTRTEATNGNHRQVVVLGDPSTNAGVAPVDATSGLKVDLGTDNDVTVTGTVTANAGTGTFAVSASSLPLPTGAATETTVGTLVTNSNFDSKVGSLTETAPGTDTASSGLNGRLQRIAQRITSLIALLPTSLGAGGGLKVDGSGTALPVSDGAGSLTVDNNGTFAVQAASAGVAAHDAAVSGNPVLQGFEAHTVRPTAVADGDVVRAGADVYSRAFSIRPAVTQTSSNGTAITTNTNTSAVSAPSAGSHLRIYRLHAQNSSATGTWLYWTEGSGGAKKYPMYLAQNQVVSINVGGEWELPTATALFINTATTGANIEWNVGHETVID